MPASGRTAAVPGLLLLLLRRRAHVDLFIARVRVEAGAVTLVKIDNAGRVRWWEWYWGECT